MTNRFTFDEDPATESSGPMANWEDVPFNGSAVLDYLEHCHRPVIGALLKIIPQLNTAVQPRPLPATEIKAAHYPGGWLVYIIEKRDLLTFQEVRDLIAQHGLKVDTAATTENRIVAR